MQTIAINSPKGGVGKSTLSILLSNVLTSAGKKVLAIDTDTVNHSLSFYHNDNYTIEQILSKNIFHVFGGGPVKENVLPISQNLDLIHSDIRLIDFRAVEYHRLKKILKTIKAKYDYCIIDTSPDYNNIVINAFYAADILITPTLPDLFNYQSVKFLVSKLEDLEIDSLDLKVVFNQYQKPKSEKKTTFSNQLLDVFYNDTNIAPYITKNPIPKSAILRKYINTDLRIKNNKTFGKLYNNLTVFLAEVFRAEFKEVATI